MFLIFFEYLQVTAALLCRGTFSEASIDSLLRKPGESKGLVACVAALRLSHLSKGPLKGA